MKRERLYEFSRIFDKPFFDSQEDSEKKGAVYSPYNLSTTIVDLFPGKGLPSLEKIALEALENSNDQTRTTLKRHHRADLD